MRSNVHVVVLLPLLLSASPVVVNAGHGGLPASGPCATRTAETQAAWQRAKTSSVSYPGTAFAIDEKCGDCDTELALALLHQQNITLWKYKVDKKKKKDPVKYNPREKFWASSFFDTRLPEGKCRFEDGIEVGALGGPQNIGACSESGRMLYVDQWNADELKRLYPELSAHKGEMRESNLFDDGNTLRKVQSNSRGFFISSHVIEHMYDPILAVQNWLRVVKPGGVIGIIAPYKCSTFDSHRLTTTFEHLWFEHNAEKQNAPKTHFAKHLAEWTLAHMWATKQPMEEYDDVHAWFVNDLANGTFEARGGMHFHTWTRTTWVKFWLELRRRGAIGTAELTQFGFDEKDMFVAVTKRDPDPDIPMPDVPPRPAPKRVARPRTGTQLKAHEAKSQKQARAPVAWSLSKWFGSWFGQMG